MSEYNNGLEKSMADQAKTNADPYGDHAGFDLTDAQRTNAQRRDEQRRSTVPSSGSSADGAWFLVMAVLPWFVLLLAMFYCINIVAGHALAYRAFLRTVTPEDASPTVVAGGAAAAMLTVIVALFVLRRVLGNVWARGGAPTIVAWLILFPVSVLIVAVMILTPGVVLVTNAIAAGRIGGGDSLRAWPLTLCAIGITWWSIGTTRRAVRRASRQRYRDWWQAPDGYWYPPEVDWTPYASENLPLRTPCTPPTSPAWEPPQPGR